MKAILFPGQGSQQKGMGAELFEQFPAECALAKEILGYSVPRLCREDPEGRLHRTEVAQPALFFVHALRFLRHGVNGGPPAFYAGHSLGEYNALFAAGAFDLETGLRLVQRRGRLMGRADGGVMVAVVGWTADQVAAFLSRHGESGVEIANDNAPRQVVLSGAREAVSTVVESLRAEAAVRCIALQVSGAFHSRWMVPAAEEFEPFVAGFRFHPLEVPVVANVTARPYGADSPAPLLARQIRCPVRWRETMAYLRDQGVTEVTEMGTGQTLTKLWRLCRESEPPSRPSRPPARPTPPPPSPTEKILTAERLGCPHFRADYGVRYAYASGAMYQGIASVEMVTRMGKAGLLGFFGTGGLPLAEVEEAIGRIQAALTHGESYGMNLLHDVEDPEMEAATVELFLRRGVRFVDAAAFLGITPPLVHFRFHGAHRDGAGRPVALQRVLAKVSRPEIARLFLEPPPAELIQQLTADGRLTREEGEVAACLPISEDVCVEADSGGHTDGGRAYTLMPAMLDLRDRMMSRHAFPNRIRIGAAGGIGSPEAAAAALVLGADFLVTGSINQCTPEAGTSDTVKDLLAGLDVQDTAYAPAGDLFEMGARVQVVRKGTLFAARANKLQELYRRHSSLEDLDGKTRRTLEEKYFHRSLEEVWQETRAYLERHKPTELARAERNPKVKMARLFQWYFAHTTRAAREGVPQAAANYQVHCGPAMGAFNRFVAGSDLEPWRSRHVDVIAERLMEATARLLERRLRRIATPSPEPSAAPSAFPAVADQS